MIAASFADKVIRISPDFKTESFPERFANEIYVSELNDHFSYSYNSPFSVKYVAQGSEHYRLNGIMHHVKAGSALLINSGSEVESMTTKIKSGEGLNKGMSVFLDPQMVYDIFSAGKLWPVDIPHWEPAADRPLALFLDDIIRPENALALFCKSQYLKFFPHPGYQLLEDDYYRICEAMFSHQKLISLQLEHIVKVRYSTRKEILKRVSLAKTIMDDTYRDIFSLDRLARQSALSKYFLVRSFKQVYNVTPNHYFIRLKIEKAKELLRQGHAVSDVATHLNYPALSSFSRQFRLYTQKSPSAFCNGR